MSTFSKTYLLDVSKHFISEDLIRCVEPLGEGFINDSFIIRTVGDAPDYLLQRKNHLVFTDVPAMMDNIRNVTNHIKQKCSDPMRETLTVIPSKDGKLYRKNEDGTWWAVCVFIDDTSTHVKADTVEQVFQGGRCLGRFQNYLSDFTSPLSDTIKGFHNIRWRFLQWDESLRLDSAGRKDALSYEIEWIESRRERMLHFWDMVERGILPRRVTHNDAKIGNILFDKKGENALCLIDLDTVMYSTSLNDVGDALRTYTNRSSEDEPDFTKVTMDIERFRAYMTGYLSERKAYLTESEVENLAFSGLYITYEQILRFLMDYIDGDTYYKIQYPEHNLVRTRSQIVFYESMEKQYDRMCEIVKGLAP